MSTRDEIYVAKKLSKIVEKMPLDEQVTIGLGFYNFDQMYAEELATEKYDDFWGFDDDPEADTPDSTTSVNGAWDRTQQYNGLTPFQNFNETDDDFDNLFTKKSRKKLGKGIKKLGKKIKKGTKKLSINNIKKGIKKITLKNIGKGIKKVGKAIGKGIKKVGNVLKSATLFVPRQAARGLIALNYRGFAYKLNWANENDKNKMDKINKKWKALGGKTSALRNAYRSGYKKKALFCGVKCKKKLAQQTAKKSKFVNADGSVNLANYELDTTKLYDILKGDMIYSNDGGAVSVPVSVALGSAVIGALGTYLSSIPQSRAIKKQVENQKKRDDAELKLMAKDQKVSEEKVKKELELVEKKVNDELNPINQILNNPNLSQAEKQEAVKQVEKALDTSAERKGKFKKMALYGVIGLVALVVLLKFGKKK